MMQYDLLADLGQVLQVGLDTRTAGWSRYQTIHFWRSSPLFTHISIEFHRICLIFGGFHL